MAGSAGTDIYVEADGSFSKQVRDLGGGGGGGGASTIADGADVTQGAVADAAVVTDADGTLSAKARGLIVLVLAMSAKLPATLGVKAAASSLAVTNSTEDIAQIGSLTETAPVTDIASSGLNGRLQRIAQRITSLIALLPTALGQGTMATSLKVVLPSDQAAIPVTLTSTTVTGTVATQENRASSASITTLASSASSAQFLAANAARIGLILVNTDANAVLVKYGTTASATSYTVRIPLNGYWEMPTPMYTGRIDVLWEADGSGSLIGTEL